MGIRKQHTATIADDIRRRVEADLKDSSSQGAPAQRKVTLCVEGNISAGKSTFLSLMKEHADLSGMIDVSCFLGGSCVLPITCWRRLEASVACDLHRLRARAEAHRQVLGLPSGRAHVTAHKLGWKSGGGHSLASGMLHWSAALEGARHLLSNMSNVKLAL